MPSLWGLAGGAAAEGAFQPARPVAAGRVSCLDFARSDGRGLLGHCECVCVCVEAGLGFGAICRMVLRNIRRDR